jgi:hypothetical protein
LKFHTLIPLILTLSLLGCQPSPPLPQGEGQGVRETPVPTAAPTLTPTPTEVPLEALPVEEIVKKYLAGEIDDVNVLNFEQQKVFSIALNEKRNELDGSHTVTYVDKSGKKLYLGPDGKFHPEPQTVERRKPSVLDNEGYIHIFDEGEWKKIAGSQNIQYDDFENFPWPKTELTDPQILDENDQHPLTTPEWLYKVADGNQMTMLPIIILSKEVGEMNIVGLNDTGTITAYVPHENDRYSVDMSIVIGNVTLYADGVTARSAVGIDEFTTFWKTLEENTVYYLIISTNQKDRIKVAIPGSNGQEITDPYQGIAPTNQTTDIVTGNTESKDITLIVTQALVKKSGD